MSPQSPKWIGLDPTSALVEVDEQRSTPRPRPASLDGAVVGLVANGLGESESFLHAIYELLAKDNDLAGMVPVVKPSVSVPPDPDDWTRLTSEASLAITGFGG
jgi:hypothetical protein